MKNRYLTQAQAAKIALENWIFDGIMTGDAAGDEIKKAILERMAHGENVIPGLKIAHASDEEGFRRLEDALDYMASDPGYRAEGPAWGWAWEDAER